MDKKRRKKTSLKTETKNLKNKCSLYAISQLLTTQEECGLISKKFKFLDTYGVGYFEYHQFDGLHISLFDAILKKDFVIHGYLSKQFLELSFLIEGEQIISIDNNTNDIIYESQECYLIYVPEVSGSIAYHKRKRLKEIKIRMDTTFIQRHRLNESYNILERFALKNLQNGFTMPLCTKTQEILTQILLDQRKGLLKRLFLESKTLELIALKLDSKKVSNPKVSIQTDHLVKKLYQTQFLISSDLSIQYSIPLLARKIGLNDFVLKKEFKRVFGQTIFEYATEQRMNKAKELLHHSSKPIYEISEHVGYKNSTHFTAAFKKIAGITPKKYRDKGISEKN
ncbi:AraC family transcriptional regulator [Aquimarina sp. AD10]|uniref:helix-turn-helix transcriptional regulator n=1 Tax=Aquimarina sp. AD10 TaxID=1714849 RepID=UPI000E52FC16|nr:AraC family transcriptional regulator [Aquimarina sp. AD10]AXT62695.1 AraC family transcriptional regulator [Aquimarina sp. AD10]RKN01878.1 helix-turn-helix domain-containing protein [Aquimarina sp. AD10]